MGDSPRPFAAPLSQPNVQTLVTRVEVFPPDFALWYFDREVTVLTPSGPEPNITIVRSGSPAAPNNVSLDSPTSVLTSWVPGIVIGTAWAVNALPTNIVGLVAPIAWPQSGTTVAG